MTTTEHAQLELALALHRAIAPDPARPACCSPLSIASALGMTAEATAGETRAQLLALLGDLDVLRERLHVAARAESAELALANTVWTEDRVELSATFVSRLAGWPDSAACHAPFRTAPGRARELINADVAETTRGLIPELIPDGAVDADTIAAIVNALYLKASWDNPFTESATRDRPFSGAGKVPTMALTHRMRYAESGGWRIAVLPAGAEVEAAVLLPDRPLAEAEAGLTPAALGTLLEEAAPREVELRLPRFEVRAQSSLSGALAGLGVREMFGPGADFSPMTRARVLVSEVLHESVLRVDEQGFEGAAATAVLVRLAMVTTDRPIPFHVDRPFLFLVRDRRTGVVYFLARVASPVP
ncbi:serpin family protein [Sciscionella sediminilitoris]|uniref:serpin family protein n=1 Tax=Sciscionella sediminilitoris TaxID=1445613 RepID=UPI0004DFA47E|nr:serpin family protein [Sciscionella sp. SE31]